MITYICHNKNDKTGENLPCTNNRCETSICPSCGGRADAISEIFWCPECQVPIYEKNCPVCGQEGKKLTSDVRPVFPEERLLLEIILEKPFAFEKDSVWNGNGNNYFVNGKKIKFSVKDLKNKDADAIRKQYEELKAQNTYQYFEKQMERFILCNKERYNRIVEEAKGYIRRKEFEEDTCFYCGKKLGKNIHVDHFIPWSFVKDDKLWNFVLSCARCNERKSNKLPKQDFLIKIEQRNKGIQVVDNIIVQKDFERYSQDLLNRMWKYAKMSGLKEVEMRT